MKHMGSLFPNHGYNLSPLQWKRGVLTTGPPGKSLKVLVIQSSPTLCDPMDYNPPGSSVHEIFQVRILE